MNTYGLHGPGRTQAQAQVGREARACGQAGWAGRADRSFKDAHLHVSDLKHARQRESTMGILGIIS